MTWYTCIYLTNNEDCFTRWVCFIYIPGLVLFLLLIKAISLCLRGVSKALGGSSCEFFAYVKINESPLHFSLTVFLWSSIKKALDKIAIIKALRNDRRIGEENEYFLVGVNTMIFYKSCGRCFLKVWVCLFQRFHTSWMNVYSMALTSVSSHINLQRRTMIHNVWMH